jgi:TonB family protein
MSLPANAESLGIFLVAAAVKAAMVLCAAWGITAAWRKRSAALRHQVWLAAILLSLAIPAISPLVPAWHSKTLGFAAWHWGETDALVREGAADAPFIVHAVSARTFTASWPEIVLGVWALGCGFLLMRLAMGFARMAAVLGRSTLLTDDGWVGEVESISKTLRISRLVRLLQSADPDAMPFACGLIRPTILVPASALDWPPERRHMVLLHELSHIARHDCAAQIASEFVRAVYWFNALIWLAVARLRYESECACDDSVLNSGVEAPCYADDLLALARTLKQPAGGWQPALAMARSTHLERRFAAMLNPLAERRVSSTKFKLLLSLAALCVLLTLAAVRLPGQNGSGKFSGTVYDPSGAAIPNATIIMIDHAVDTRDMTTSDAAGRFEFTGLPAGEYEVEVMKPGFKLYTQPAVTLEAGRDFSLDAHLDIAAVDETVQVAGQRSSTGAGGSAAVVNQNPKRIRIGEDVVAAHLFTKVMPVYPESAKAEGVEGTVVLHAVIGKDGSLLSLRVMNGQIDPDLARSAVEAVSHWRYRPTLLNGQPIEVDTTIEVHFTLQK